MCIISQSHQPCTYVFFLIFDYLACLDTANFHTGFSHIKIKPCSLSVDLSLKFMLPESVLLSFPSFHSSSERVATKRKQ